MGKQYCGICGIATSSGLSGTIYYCGHKKEDTRHAK